MIKTIILSGALAIGLATAASAGIAYTPIQKSDGLIVKVAEGCGAGFWRGPMGKCHPMAVGRGNLRGRPRGSLRQYCV